MFNTVLRIFRPEPKCKYCGQVLPQTPDAMFCSRDCYDHYRYLENAAGPDR